MTDWSSKTVLVVDDEALFVSSVMEAIKDRFPGVNCLTAGNGKEALEHIDRKPVDVLMTDLSMPVMDGFQLLVSLSSRRFRAPIVVVTAFATAEAEAIVRKGGALEVLEKPVDVDEMLNRIEELAIEPKLEIGVLSPAGFSRLLARERRSGVLTVVHSKQRGELVFDQGELIDAVLGDDAGDKAALKIFDWPEGRLELREIKPQCRRRVESFLDDLLLGIRTEPTDEIHSNNSDSADVLWAESDESILKEEKQPSGKKEINMGSVNESLDQAMAIDGSLVVALVDFESGMTLGTRGNAFDVELAASGNTEVVISKMKVMKQLKLEGGIEDILITLEDQYHLIRPMTKVPNLFLYLAISREKGNLGMARHKLSEIEKNLSV